MKIEKRGKYAGVKVHLEPKECEEFMKLHSDACQAAMKVEKGKQINYFSLAVKLGKKLNELVQTEPDTLTERTPEQVAAVVESEFITAQQKLEAIKKGKDWHGFTKANLK